MAKQAEPEKATSNSSKTWFDWRYTLGDISGSWSMWSRSIAGEGFIARQRKQGRGAPAAGCFGQLHVIEGYDGCARQHAPEEQAEWDRLTERFAAVDYGDGSPVIGAAPRTS